MSNGYGHNDGARVGEQEQITEEKDAGETELRENGDGTISNGKATNTGEVRCKVASYCSSDSRDTIGARIAIRSGKIANILFLNNLIHLCCS